MSEKINPHANHRQRVRDAFRQTDMSTIPDRHLLEFLLFYAIPRRDTNDTAAILLEKFGSLSAVLNAPVDELAKVEGMGESSALLLSTLPEVISRCSKKSSGIITPDEPGEYLFRKLSCLQNEVFAVMCLDSVSRITDCRIIAFGGESYVTVNKRDILQTAFDAGADSVIIAHNHPGGEAAPSKEDGELTAEIGRLLAETGIKLSDHIIVGRTDYISLASTAKFKDIFM